jgi:DNA-directed RNA polymerase II subunit RPB2
MEYVHKFLSEPGFLVQHHLESYNQFLERIPIIMHKKNPLTILKKQEGDDFEHECNVYVGGKDGKQIFFGNPMFYENDIQKIMYPNDARLRNMTYAFSIHASLTFTFKMKQEEQEEFTTPPILIGYIPIMVQSKQCILYSMPPEVRFNMGECSRDPGGYFIVDGSEKAIICQEGRANNAIVVMKNYTDAYYYAAAIKSESEDETKLARSTSVGIVTKEDSESPILTKDGFTLHQIVVELPDVHQPIPLFIVMRALGIISDKQIIDTCLLDEDEQLIDYFHDSVCDAGSIYTQAQAIQFIGTFTKYHSVHYALRVLSELFLPHIGELNFIDKAYFLGYMVKRVLRVAVGIDPVTDRDSFRYKRMDSTGVLLTHLFSDFYSQQLKHVRRVIDTTYNKNEKLYDDPIIFPSLFKTNYQEFFEERVTEKGIKNGFKGRWGATSYTQRVGVSQKLNRLSFNSAISHLRKCVLQIDKSAKITAPRLLHSSQWGVFDPVDTPDGGDVGAHKHLAICTRITEGFPKEVLLKEFERLQIDVIKMEDSVVSNIKTMVKVFLNGEWYGCIDNPQEVVTMLKMSRRHGHLPISTSISWNISENTLFLFTDAGRLQRPVFYIDEDRYISLSDQSNRLSWSELIHGTEKRPCAIEYMDADEANTALITFNKDEDFTKTRHTHVEIHGSLLLGFMGNQIIFPEHSPLPRNSFSCGQSKQAVALYHTNYQNRMDTMGVVLNYAQTPLVQSSYIHKFGTLPYGVNAMVAIMSYTGYNTEDAILFNRGALERGMFNTSYFKTYEMYESSDGENELLFQGGTNTDDNGLVDINTEVTPETVLMRMVNGTKVKNIYPKRDQLGYVDKTFLSGNAPGHRMAKVRICHQRTPSIGDKFASRAGQKGTCGLIIPEEDMPFNADGIRPDLIINPHALPSRMTLGQLIESIMGKVHLDHGSLGDCTAFNTDNKEYAKELNRNGFHSSGTEVLYNGMTGEPLESNIFMGPTYYLRLKHMVEDKINFRERGPMTTLTRQPVQGRSNEGGLRIGEMERDGVIANGMTTFVQESMMVRGDGTMVVNNSRKPYQICVDNTSGLLAVYNEHNHVMISPTLDGFKEPSKYKTSFSVCHVPYSFKLLMQELATMNVQMRLITSNNIDHIQSMKGKIIQTKAPPSFMTLTNEVYSVKENKLFVSDKEFDVGQDGAIYPNCFDDTKVFYHEHLNPTMFPCIESKHEYDQLRFSMREIEPYKSYESVYHKERCGYDIYKTNADSFDTTLDYYWNHMKTGIFVRIKNNKVFNFILMYNKEYRNNYNFENPSAFLESLPPKKRRGMSSDPTTWHATNCLLRTEKIDRDPTDAYMSQMYDMLVDTCSNRKVNDCIFFMTRKDFPHVRKDWKEAFDALYGDAVLSEEYNKKPFIPVVAQSTTVNHADFPFPTGDDWMDICKDKWFATYNDMKLECKNGSTKVNGLPPWESRKDEFIWRGQGTGCGNTSETNPRMNLDKITQSNLIPELNARITNFTDRIKGSFKDGKVNLEYLGYKKFQDLYVTMDKQLSCKFILNVEGNSAAYRFGSLLGLGFCVLNIESTYTLWFEPMLKKGVIQDADIDKAHCISVKHDLSDLAEVIEWCKANDAICKKISENGMEFYKKHFTKDFVYDYVADMCNSISSLLGRQKNMYDEDAATLKSLKPKKSKVTLLKCSAPTNSTPNTSIIIVPFRDDGHQNRTQQLNRFVEYYKDIPILVVEQSKDGKKFNRGALLNIGYDFIVEKMPHFTTFLMHDVDILMEPDIIEKYYVEDERKIVHLGMLIKNSKYKETKESYFLGRVIRFSKSAYKEINGFPNTFYGWGGEDDALAHRIGNIPVYRPNEKKEGIELETVNDIIEDESKTYKEEYKIEQLIADNLQWKIDGINSLQYTIVENKNITPSARKLTVQLAPTVSMEESAIEPVQPVQTMQSTQLKEKKTDMESDKLEVIGGTDTLTQEELKKKIDFKS